jgi:hypothetical protein
LGRKARQRRRRGRQALFCLVSPAVYGRSIGQAIDLQHGGWTIGF